MATIFRSEGQCAEELCQPEPPPHDRNQTPRGAPKHTPLRPSWCTQPLFIGLTGSRRHGTQEFSEGGAGKEWRRATLS